MYNTHKKIEDKRIPKDRKFLLVGAWNKEDTFGYLCDNLKDNISEKILIIVSLRVYIQCGNMQRKMLYP